MLTKSLWLTGLFCLPLAVLHSSSAQRASLNAARVTASADTFDNYTGEAKAAVRGKTSYVRTIVQRPGGFDLTYVWLDSLNAPTTTQGTGVRARDASTEWQRVRSATDSASLLVANGHVSGWVVPQGEQARLFDTGLKDPLLDANVVELAFAAARPRVGQTLPFNTYGLYTATPIAPIADTMTVKALVDLHSANGLIKAVLVTRARNRFWFDATTGIVLARQGTAAGGRIIWWHVRRGISVPES